MPLSPKKCKQTLHIVYCNLSEMFFVVKSLTATLLRVLSVVYFDQHLGAAHSKHLTKSAFLHVSARFNAKMWNEHFFPYSQMGPWNLPHKFHLYLILTVSLVLDQQFCVDWRLGISSKTFIFASFFIIFASKSYKNVQKNEKQIWSVQHPNAGTNILHCKKRKRKP